MIHLSNLTPAKASAAVLCALVLGWNTMRNIPNAPGLTVRTRGRDGLRFNTIKRGRDAIHEVRADVPPGMPEQLFLTLTAWIDPTDAAPPDTDDDAIDVEPDEALADFRNAVNDGLVEDSIGDGAELRIDEIAVPSEPDYEADTVSRVGVDGLRYVRLPLPKQWDVGSMRLGANSVNPRTPREILFHRNHDTCDPGRQHVIRLTAEIAPAYPDSPPARRTLEFAVACKGSR
ncbi:hypothetical protein J2X46_004647 [Nocardioides sp. BE266]|uniref:hypothetical protein n=1 Tax=Nocardioides sp. BE266 TaxID=2817725 RepID=UPI0028585A0A|nr:hypothetical protein [Nocardioides sp. BE266]MDR7255637.1 hypothetical protein [Nocardioides sp. BE266]